MIVQDIFRDLETVRKEAESMREFVKKEAVLVIAFVCAAVSMFFVPPSAAYAGYIDVPVLVQLFCLMTVVAGLQQYGLFRVLARKILSGRKSFRFLCAVLVLLPYVASMFVTNDVALLTFVPFALLLLGMCGRSQTAPLIIVLQTAAANLGSMLLPSGNPQNLFLFSRYHMTMAQLVGTVAPFAAVSLVLVLVPCFFVPDLSVSVDVPAQEGETDVRRLAVFGALFVLCMLCVLHVVSVYIALAAVVAAALLVSPSTLRRTDYALLATFVCFFVFSGNMGNIPAVRAFLEAMLEKSVVVTSALTSQVISNVPAAVLLAEFTSDGHGLLLGTNLGGLGTPVASLASLISLKLYARSECAEMKSFLAAFAAVNAGGLVILFAFGALTGLL